MRAGSTDSEHQTTHSEPSAAPSLLEIIRQWGRIGCIGFGGPPAHIALFRELCVTRRGWLTSAQFERAIAATNLLPGPASTQLAIYCAWRLRGARGALLGGLCFIVPGLAAIIALAVLFLSGSPPAWLRGAGLGAGAAVAAVAVRAGLGVAGPWLVLVLLGCGAVELASERLAHPGAEMHALPVLPLVWTALKVGALAFGGGFVIVPLMESDAVSTYHWMSHSQFLNAVALGQVTPGPIVQTVAVVGYAAGGLPGALLAAAVAFAPSFSFVLVGAARFERLLLNERVRAFLAGAAPSTAGAIVGAAVPLTAALAESWQYAVLAVAAIAPLLLRRGVVPTLLLAACVGVAAAQLGAPIPH
jgi:chromate transporter